MQKETPTSRRAVSFSRFEKALVAGARSHCRHKLANPLIFRSIHEIKDAHKLAA